MADDSKSYPIEDWDNWAGSIDPIYPGARWTRYESAEQAGWSSTGLADAERFAKEIGSAAVMVIFGGAVLAHWGQVERRYLCHSMRKSLLSALYGEHVARGTIDLQETLGELGIDDEPPLTDSEKGACVADLLKSRSGVYLPAAYEDDRARQGKPARGSHAPGTHWHYNNWDFNVLATIFNQKTGCDVLEEIHRRLAAPLQMQDFEPRHGHYHVEPNCSLHPAYPLRMSARDLARFGLLYLYEGRWKNERIVPQSWVQESTRPYSPTDVADYGYGYMWWTAGGDLGQLGAYFAHGVGNRVYVVPRAQLVIVHRSDTYASRRVGDGDIRRLVDKILRARRAPPAAQPSFTEFPEPQPPKASVDAGGIETAALCGEYTLGRLRPVVRQTGGHLEVRWSHGWFRLVPRSPSEFEVEDMLYTVAFDLDHAGQATCLRLWQPFDMLRSPA